MGILLGREVKRRRWEGVGSQISNFIPVPLAFPPHQPSFLRLCLFTRILSPHPPLIPFLSLSSLLLPPSPYPSFFVITKPDPVFSSRHILKNTHTQTHSPSLLWKSHLDLRRFSSFKGSSLIYM